MQTPIQISFRDIEHSDAVEARVRERAERLVRLSERLTQCHVVIGAPHRHHHKGRLYDVRVQLHVPGGEIVASREGSQNHAYEDVYVVVRDAFDAAERQLEDWLRKRNNGHHRG